MLLGAVPDLAMSGSPSAIPVKGEIPNPDRSAAGDAPSTRAARWRSICGRQKGAGN